MRREKKSKPERILKFLFSSSASEHSPALLTCQTLLVISPKHYWSYHSNTLLAISLKHFSSTDRNQCKCLTYFSLSRFPIRQLPIQLVTHEKDASLALPFFNDSGPLLKKEQYSLLPHTRCLDFSCIISFQTVTTSSTKTFVYLE